MEKSKSAVTHTKPVYMEPHKDMPSTGVRIGVKGTVQCCKRLDFAIGKRKVVQYYECSPRTTGGLWLEENVWVRKLWWKVPWSQIIAQIMRRSVGVLAAIVAICIYFLCIAHYDTSGGIALAIASAYAVFVFIAVYWSTSEDITVRAGMSHWVKCDLNRLENVMALVEIQRLENVDEASIICDIDELIS